MAFALSLVALVGLSRRGLANPDDDPNATRLTLREEERQWVLQYSFSGPLGKRREFTCRISKEGDRKLRESEGYLQQDWVRLNAELAAKLTEEARKEGALPYGQAKIFGRLQGGWEWDPYEPMNRNDEAYHRDLQGRLEEWLATNLQKMKDDINLEFMISRGFLPHQGKWFLDYSNLIARATPELEDCIKVLNQATSGDAETLMGFFQMMHYRKIDDVEGGRFTNGFRVPTSVLIKNEGDCDSKAATFCAIQRNNPAQLVIFRSAWPSNNRKKGHALVGVEAWKEGMSPLKRSWNDGPWKTQRLTSMLYGDPILMENRYYTPVDVAGFGRTEFGRVLPGREGEYYVIPIRPLDRYIQKAPARKSSHAGG